MQVHYGDLDVQPIVRVGAGAGPIPRELGALSELYMLLLNNNGLTGEMVFTQYH